MNNHLGWFSNDTDCLGREELMDTADMALPWPFRSPGLAGPCSSSCSLARCLPPAQLPHFMSGHMSRHRNLSWPSCPLSWSTQFTVPNLSSSSLPAQILLAHIRAVYGSCLWCALGIEGWFCSTPSLRNQSSFVLAFRLDTRQSCQ